MRSAFGLDVRSRCTGRRGDGEVREAENAFLFWRTKTKIFPSRARTGCRDGRQRRDGSNRKAAVTTAAARPSLLAPAFAVPWAALLVIAAVQQLTAWSERAIPVLIGSSRRFRLSAWCCGSRATPARDDAAGSDARARRGSCVAKWQYVARARRGGNRAVGCFSQ
jgi:hypothetical protein